LHFKELGITHIDIYFQPIVSIKKKKIFGYEALLRGYKNDIYIPPNILFEEAKVAGLALKLDKLARIKSIKKFKDYYDRDNKVLLFLNFESSSINNTFKSDQYSFEEVLATLNIPAKNIVLEVKEDEIQSTQSLKDFSNYYKERGFNIAIDDFGTGDSQFDRLSIVKPDIVKIDKSLLKDIDTNDINAAILGAIANMCYKIGAIALSEGVENDSEVLKSLNFGIDLFQGYYFAYPSIGEADYKDVVNKIQSIGYKHKDYLESTIRIKNDLQLEALNISEKIISIITKTQNIQSTKVLEILEEVQIVEALYFINSYDSTQIGETTLLTKQRGFYEPSVHGEDHSLKDYYYICKNSKDGKFISQKYISSASGNMCRTFSKRFSHNSKEIILCLDLYL
jgi:EAL domain-containing protein (putative c-di-GMP-specific phosphodiesterase class I)